MIIYIIYIYILKKMVCISNLLNQLLGFMNWFLYLTTVDGQNIQTLQHALCWTPAPPNLNVSARVLAKVMLGVWFFSSIGANALQVTITLNFGGEGVVPDRRGLNISSIYGRRHPTCNNNSISGNIKGTYFSSLPLSLSLPPRPSLRLFWERYSFWGKEVPAISGNINSNIYI